MQQSRRLVDTVEHYYHCKCECPENNQPYEREKICAERKEENRPHKIHRKLNHIYGKGLFCLGLVFLIHKVRGNSHKNIQKRPHDGEKPVGRRKGRLDCGFGIAFKAFERNQRGYSADGKGNENGNDEPLEVNARFESQKNHTFRIAVLIVYTKRCGYYSLFNYIFDRSAVFHTLVGTENGQMTFHGVLNRGAGNGHLVVTDIADKIS